MELTITFFIKFTLIVHFVLVLFFNLFRLLRFNDKFDRYLILNFFSKGLHFSLLSFNYPIWRANDKGE
jgi:type IV secretory pathway VirB3-like protein